MNIYVPFALSSPWALGAARLALVQDGWPPICVHMTGEESYFGLLKGLWDKRETFAVVEHDIVVWPGCMNALENCPHPWCTVPYYCSVGWIVDGLGCTKFTEEIMRQVPGMFDQPFPDCCDHSTHYCGLDRLIAHRFEQLGIAPHVHNPGVVNLNQKWTV